MPKLKGVDIIDGAQFSREDIDHILEVSSIFRKRLKEEKSLDLLSGSVLGTLFFEASTRTRISFETAMHRLGGAVVGFDSAEATSVSKGETFTDTIRTIDSYVDCIVVRHPMIGSAKMAADVAQVPIINGGDGAGEHPTQALLDLYTIIMERGRMDGLTIVICGDLKHGRTVHSGVELYKHFDCNLVFVSPESLGMPSEIISSLRESDVTVGTTSDLKSAMQGADVLYMTRIQRERFKDPDEFEKVKLSYILSRKMVEEINPSISILHPLPRVDEIAENVDQLPSAAYFRQARNGVFIRMALLAMVLGEA